MRNLNLMKLMLLMEIIQLIKMKMKNIYKILYNNFGTYAFIKQKMMDKLKLDDYKDLINLFK